MKIKKSQLKQIIQEESQALLDEGFLDKMKSAVGMGPGADDLLLQMMADVDEIQKGLTATHTILRRCDRSGCGPSWESAWSAPSGVELPPGKMLPVALQRLEEDWLAGMAEAWTEVWQAFGPTGLDLKSSHEAVEAALKKERGRPGPKTFAAFNALSQNMHGLMEKAESNPRAQKRIKAAHRKWKRFMDTPELNRWDPNIWAKANKDLMIDRANLPADYGSTPQTTGQGYLDQVAGRAADMSAAGDALDRAGARRGSIYRESISKESDLYGIIEEELNAVLAEMKD